jgi:hypothetical protein
MQLFRIDGAPCGPRALTSMDAAAHIPRCGCGGIRRNDRRVFFWAHGHQHCLSRKVRNGIRYRPPSWTSRLGPRSRLGARAGGPAAPRGGGGGATSFFCDGVMCLKLLACRPGLDGLGVDSYSDEGVVRIEVMGARISIWH